MGETGLRKAFGAQKVDSWTNYVSCNRKLCLQWVLRAAGASLILLWYLVWGYDENKLQYNSRHPYILVIPLVGYLMVRNSSAYITNRYSVFLEFLGRNTLETYVLQFHLFMCREVQHTLVILPGANRLTDGDGGTYGFFMRLLNMLVLGCAYLFVAIEARKATVVTQESFVKLTKTFVGGATSGGGARAVKLESAAPSAAAAKPVE